MLSLTSVFFRMTRLSGVLWLLLVIFSCGRSGNNEKHHQDSITVIPAIKLTTLWVDSGYFSRVKPYLDSFYQVHHIRSPKALALKYERLAEVYYYHLHGYDTSSLYLDSIEQFLHGDPEGQPHINQVLAYYFLRGNLAIYNKNYDEGFKYYYKGKQLIDQLPGNCGVQRYYNTLGHILYRQEKFIEAAQYMKQSYENVTSCLAEPPERIATVQREALSNIGLCYENAGMYDSAVAYYNRALQFVEDNRELFRDKKLALLKFRGVILGNRGGTYAKQRKYREAEADLKESIAINYTPPGEKGDAILTKIKLADLYLEKGSQRQAEMLIHELDSDVMSHRYIVSDLRLALVKHKYYKNRKNYEHALHYLNIHNTLRDSIRALTDYNIERHTDHVKEFNNLEKNFELELMKSQNEQKNLYIALAVVTALMGLMIIALLLRRRAQNKKFILELTELNEQVQKSNEKLSHSLELLQKSEHENSRMIKIIAHDLRSPIAGIMSLVRMIRHDHQELTAAEFKEYIDLVEKAGGNALTFIEDMLDSRKGSSELEKTEVDIKSVLRSCVSLMQTQAEKKGQLISLESVSQVVSINEEKIWRLVNNLISNALKFSSPGTMVEIKAVKGHDSVIISIKDQGIGIPESEKEKLFSTFARKGRSGTLGEQSHGMGLVISKQIVDAHNGRIWFESVNGEGTTFYVELPVSKPGES